MVVKVFRISECAPIVLSFWERFRISDPPAHSLTEQNGNLSDPPFWQGTKTAICLWL